MPPKLFTDPSALSRAMAEAAAQNATPKTDSGSDNDHEFGDDDDDFFEGDADFTAVAPGTSLGHAGLLGSSVAFAHASSRGLLVPGSGNSSVNLSFDHSGPSAAAASAAAAPAVALGRTSSTTAGGSGAPQGLIVGIGGGKHVDLIARAQARQEAHEKLRRRYETLIASISQKPEGERDAARPETLMELRKLVLMEGLPDNDSVNSSTDGTCSLRGQVWKILLGVREVDADLYLELIAQRESRLYQKIRNDTFRTFKNNTNFSSRVPENQLIRVLNAYMHYVDRSQKMKAGHEVDNRNKDDKSCEHHTIPDVDSELSYVQGMNVVAAPLLYVMPEVDAFFSFVRFVCFHTPVYYSATIAGAFDGLKLVDEVLQHCDSELFEYLKGKGLTAAVYAMPPILSYSAASPPLEQLLKLWDFILAFGPYMNVVATAAQIILMRDKLLSVPQPMKFLGAQFPPLRAGPIVNLSVALVQQLPPALLTRLQKHSYEKVQAKPAVSGTLPLGRGSARTGRKTIATDQYSTLPKNFKAEALAGNISSGTASDGDQLLSPKRSVHSSAAKAAASPKPGPKGRKRR